MGEKELSYDEALLEAQAVQKWAEGSVEQEGGERPDLEHYQEASDRIDQLRSADPKFAGEFVDALRATKEMHEEMDAIQPALSVHVKEVVRRVSVEKDPELAKKVQLLPQQITWDEFFKGAYSPHLEEIYAAVKSDPRIAKVLEQDPTLLDRDLALAKRSAPILYKADMIWKEEGS